MWKVAAWVEHSMLVKTKSNTPVGALGKGLVQKMLHPMRTYSPVDLTWLCVNSRCYRILRCVCVCDDHDGLHAGEVHDHDGWQLNLGQFRISEEAFNYLSSESFLHQRDCWQGNPPTVLGIGLHETNWAITSLHVINDMDMSIDLANSQLSVLIS